MAHKVIVPQKKIMSRSFLNSGTLIVINRCNFKRVPVLLWHGKICALYTVDCPRLRNKIKTDVYNLLLFFILLQRTLTLGAYRDMQRQNTENSKQIFAEMKLRGLKSQFLNSFVCERFMYSQDRGLPILQQENRWTDRGNI
jgi:hypothetical protein